MNPSSNRTIAIIGASRGLGRGAAEAFAAAGADVIAIARDQRALEDLAAGHDRVRPLAMDVTAPNSPDAVITDQQPDVLVLVAGITPPIAPINELSWTEFSATWETDVKLTHVWLSAALNAPMRPGSRVIVISSGASLNGSPRAGGYSGAKAMQRFMAADAQVESDLRGLGITVTSVLPKLTPLTAVGAVGALAHAGVAGISVAEFTEQLGETLTPGIFGQALVDLAGRSAAQAAGSFRLTVDGIAPLV
ncbi:SDR family oxidoreductase [Nocardia sp. NEAU-G5]|uniref:SDR family oxidoreductase n=1 Tax=Nocardia albiluteola TaxID=2842303 RepID=A0ABS6B9T1_9NOCA|nr:SDR family oxidoreductase [Nocardia albiluteola]MBU3067056.1 SDR family oxidoreductase [Nocardia albiluteola]